MTRRARRIGVALAALAVGVVAAGMEASTIQPSGGDPGPALAVPFGPGERAEYQVTLGPLSVGTGVMEITGIEEVDGSKTNHTSLRITGGIPFARVDTRMDSWIDVEGVFSRRFEQDQNDLGRKRHRIYDFYPESRSYRMRLSGEVGSLPTDRPLDDVSFLYYARTLPLRVGDSYTINRYFKKDGNPVIINVLRRDTIRVPAGTFNTIVVQPIIKTDGLFSKGGEAEVHFTDDDRRVLVHVRTKVPLIGSLNLNLREYQPGVTVQDFEARD